MGVGAGLYVYDVVIKEFTFVISSPDEFLYRSSAVAEMGDRGHNRHGPKRRGAAVPL